MSQRPLWTTSDVAKALTVGVSSVKRWTDDGALESVKTFGGHRRYTIESVHAFAKSRGIPTEHLPALEDEPLDPTEALDYEGIRRELLSALESGDANSARRLVHYAMTLRTDRAAFLDRVVGAAMRLIGDLWVDGKWSIESEHRASNVISEVIDRMRPTSEGSVGLATLACPPDEFHDLPLRMVRLVLEWQNWKTDYIGADVPWGEMRRAIEFKGPSLVLLTARSAEPFQGTEFRELVEHCKVRGIGVGVGGGWARGGANRRGDRFYRFRTLRGFEKWLKSGEAV